MVTKASSRRVDLAAYADAVVELTAEYETAGRKLFDVYEAGRLAAVDEVGRNVARAKWLRDHERVTLDFIERKRSQAGWPTSSGSGADHVFGREVVHVLEVRAVGRHGLDRGCP